MRRRTLSLALPLSAAALLTIGAAAPAPVSTLKGVYSADQATAGAQLYAARCAMCHGKMLEGTFETPALQDRFIANWSKAPLSDLYDYLARAMPQFAPGSLNPDETAKIVAYLLQSNALPAGPQALPAESAALKRIMLEPQPASVSAEAVPKK
jgi:mono/diheme cytochrome c family protein